MPHSVKNAGDYFSHMAERLCKPPRGGPVKPLVIPKAELEPAPIVVEESSASDTAIQRIIRAFRRD